MMEIDNTNNSKHEMNHRRSMRLRDYDYSQDGAYFVTICTWNRECLLGEIVHGVMDLSEIGKIVREFWFEIQKHFGNIQLDAFTIMPNHLHGIMVLSDDLCRGEVSSPCLKIEEIKPGETGGDTPPIWKTGKTKNIGKGGDTPPLRKGTLGQMLGYFKYQTTKQINLSRNTPGIPIWQRNYYDHVIRNEKELTETREYIINNPLRWALDKENLNKIETDDDRRGEVSSTILKTGKTKNIGKGGVTPPLQK